MSNLIFGPGKFRVVLLQDAMGRSRMQRFYAFIETAEGDLAELLVANGLARVYGSAATPAGLSSPEREWQKLKRLEREAEVQKVGGWGAGTGRMAARLPSLEARRRLRARIEGS